MGDGGSEEQPLKIAGELQQGIDSKQQQDIASEQQEDVASEKQENLAIEEEQALEYTEENAQKLFDEGSNALKDGDYEAAAEDFSKAMEIRVNLYGQTAPECAITYFKYGTALLRKVQSERDVFSEEAAANEKGLNISEPGKEAAEENVQEDEEVPEEEEESDLELAWKMMEFARVIYEKQRSHSLEEVDVVVALADISLEKEDFHTCFEDYNKALEILRGLVDPDNRQLAELYFKTSLAHQLAEKPKEALDFCEKAVSVCQSRLQNLKSSTQVSSDQEKENIAPKVSEIAELESLLVDLKEKAEELKQMASSRPVLEMLQAENPIAAETVKQAVIAVANTIAANASKAAEGNCSSQPSSSNDTVTHLGVVGRGVKRATPIQIEDDQQSGKRSSSNSGAACCSSSADQHK